MPVRHDPLGGGALMAVRKNCEDCGAPLDPKPRVRFCPTCVDEHKRSWKRQKYQRKKQNRRDVNTHKETLFKIVSCPDDDWPCGCELCKFDVQKTLDIGHFPTGMVLEQRGRRMRVCGNLFTKQYLVELW